MYQRKCILFASLSMAVVVLGALLTWVIIPPIVDYMVDQNVILLENTEQFDRFVNVPQPLHFKVYIFNVTNVDQVQKGGVPRVMEIGPYVYDQFRKKHILNISADQTTITFDQKQTFYFNSKESAPFRQDDNIYVLNVALNSFLIIVEQMFSQTLSVIHRQINRTLEQTPIVRTVKHIFETISGGRSILQTAEDEMSATLGMLNSQIGAVFGQPKNMFLNTTPRALLFDGVPLCVKARAMTQVFCSMLKERKLNTMREMPDGSVRFAFFRYKNESSDGTYTVHSGYGNAVRVTEILKFKGKETLSTWSTIPGTNCNRIGGTDAGSFQPHLRSDKTSLLIFSTDICRTVEIFYNSSQLYKGIRGLRYTATDSFMNEIGTQYNTQCFCSKPLAKVPKMDDGCMLPGAMDMSACHGAPVVLTLPHMMNADPIYKTVHGLRPEYAQHHTFVDIEPNTGFPLRGGKRVQFNMFLRRIDHIDLTKNLQTHLLPILWVEEGINLNDNMIDLLNGKLFNYTYMLNILTFSMMVGGVVVFVVIVVWFLYKRQQSNKVYSFY